MAGGRSIEQGERARDDATATYAGSPERYVTQLLDTLRQQLDDYQFVTRLSCKAVWRFATPAVSCRPRDSHQLALPLV